MHKIYMYDLQYLLRIISKYEKKMAHKDGSPPLK